MEIIKKIIKKQENLHESRQPVIAFLGDSVTQGCFELFMQDGRIKPATRASEGNLHLTLEIQIPPCHLLVSLF